MVSKKSGLMLSIVGILSIMVSVMYISSCTRPLQDNPYSCNYVVCYNGGHCDSARCKCPVGYEGTDCSIATVDRFYGYWQLTATNIGSDSVQNIGQDSTYVVELKNTATKTSFFINNFDNNLNYSHVVCTLDSMNANLPDSVNALYFDMDTTAIQNMYYDHYRIRGGSGYFQSPDSIFATVYIRHLNSTVNWQNDTFELKMRKL
jgi:hypothetical protein